MPLPLSWPDWSRLTPPMTEGRWTISGVMKAGLWFGNDQNSHWLYLASICGAWWTWPSNFNGSWVPVLWLLLRRGAHTGQAVQQMKSSCGLLNRSWLAVTWSCPFLWKSLCPPWMWQHLPSLCARSSSGVLALGKEEKQGCMLGHVIKRVSREGYLLPESVWGRLGHFLGQRAASSDMRFGIFPCEIMGTGKSWSWTEYSS